MALLIFIAMALLCTVIHEAGHCLAARMNGVEVKEYSIGMGPRLHSWQLKHMKLSLKLLPIGGSCDIDDDAMNGLPVSKKIIIFIGGVLGNLLLAVISCVMILMALYSVKDGIEEGGTTVWFVFWNFIWDAIPQMLSTVAHTVQIIIDTFHQSNLSANIDFINQAVVQNTGGAWSRLFYIGYINYILNMCLIFFNLIPFPGLDGSYVLLSAIEATGKKIPDKLVTASMRIGICVLIAFSVIILSKEILFLVI